MNQVKKSDLKKVQTASYNGARMKSNNSSIFETKNELNLT